MYHYPTVTPGYGTYVYTTSPSSSEETQGYYPPPQYAAQGAPARTYSYHYPRRESFSYAQTPQQWYSPPGYQPQEYYVTTPTYTSPPAHHDAYVSSPPRRRSKSQRFFWAPGASGGGNDGSPKRHASKRSQKHHINIDVVDEAEDSPPYSYHTPRPAYHNQSKYARADPHSFYYQVPVYAERSDPQPKQQRPRRQTESKAYATSSRPAEPSDSRQKEYRTRRPSESKAHGTPLRPAEPYDSRPRESRTRRPSESKAHGTPSRPAKASDSQPREWTRPAKSAPTKPPPAKSTPTTSKPANVPPANPQFKQPPAPAPHRQATARDAARAGIPAGFTINNWDPDMKPMLLMGSAYDAHSLGKWIFDWTVAHYGAGSPMADIAGHVWLLMLKLASKTMRAEASLGQVRTRDERALLRRFLADVEVLWQRFDDLVDVCEKPMADRVKRRAGKAEIDAGAGAEFVKTMFGRDRRLEETEALRTTMHLWDERFDDNCAVILKRSMRR